MDLALSEEQEFLKRTAREFLEKECPPKLVREMEQDESGFPAALWKQIADLGWHGLVLPEQHGGSSGSFVDLVILLEEMGRAALPGPFLPTVVPCATTIARAGSEAQKAKFVAGIAKGDGIVTWAGQEPSARYAPELIQTTLSGSGDSLVLNGTKLFVSFANIANELLVVARDGEGLSLVLVEPGDPGVLITPLVMIDGGKQAEVVFNNVSVAAENIVGQRGQAGPIVQQALAEWTVAQCAWMVGAMERSFEMAVEYSKTRVQFGRPIGSFQALQHKAANMAIEVDGARLITYQAAWQVQSGDDASREIAMAKAWVSDAMRKVSADAHQMHGAIGFTWDYDLQLLTRRGKALEVGLGDADYHRQRLATALGM